MDVIKQITDDLQRRKEKALLGGGPERIEAQHKKGLLTARERIEKLVNQKEPTLSSGRFFFLRYHFNHFISWLYFHTFCFIVTFHLV